MLIRENHEIVVHGMLMVVKVRLFAGQHCCPLVAASLDLLFFGFVAGFAPTAVSSNDFHLKSFLYPPQVTFLLWHC